MTATRPYHLYYRQNGGSAKQIWASYSNPKMRRRAYDRLILLVEHREARRAFIDPHDEEQRDKYHAMLRGLGK